MSGSSMFAEALISASIPSARAVTLTIMLSSSSPRAGRASPCLSLLPAASRARPAWAAPAGFTCALLLRSLGCRGLGVSLGCRRRWLGLRRHVDVGGDVLAVPHLVRRLDLRTFRHVHECALSPLDLDLRVGVHRERSPD